MPTKTNPLGTKGCGEAGCAGALVSVTNAIADALSEFGITHVDMPVTPETGVAIDPGRPLAGGGANDMNRAASRPTICGARHRARCARSPW